MGYRDDAPGLSNFKKAASRKKKEGSDHKVLVIDAGLFYQLLNQVADGPNATTALLAEKIGRVFDPDTEGPIIMSQGLPKAIDAEVLRIEGNGP